MRHLVVWLFFQLICKAVISGGGIWVLQKEFDYNGIRTNGYIRGESYDFNTPDLIDEYSAFIHFFHKKYDTIPFDINDDGITDLTTRLEIIGSTSVGSQNRSFYSVITSKPQPNQILQGYQRNYNYNLGEGDTIHLNPTSKAKWNELNLKCKIKDAKYFVVNRNATDSLTKSEIYNSMYHVYAGVRFEINVSNELQIFIGWLKFEVIKITGEIVLTDKFLKPVQTFEEKVIVGRKI